MLITLFSDFKELIASTLHLSRDALHVHVGLVLFLAGGALLRGPRRFRNAFLGVLALCIAGEVADAAIAWNDVHGPNWRGGAKDVVSTMLWPAAWLLAWPYVIPMLRSVGAGPAVRQDGPKGLG
jgi:hypothetical protein